MSGRNRFSDLRDQLSPESKKAVEAKVELARGKSLAELRQSRHLTKG